MNPADLHKANELTVQQLRSFCMVFQQQSYSGAARTTDLSVPTIWEQVRMLEKRYGTVLFRREGRRIQATPAAEVLYEALQPLLAGIDSTFEQLRELDVSQPQQLTLVTGARMLLEELGSPLHQFREQFPQVGLRLLHGDSRTAERLITEGEADVALTLEPGPGSLAKTVASQRAYPIDYLAVLPPDHPLATKTSLRLRDLVAHPLIVGHSGTFGRVLLEQALHREDLLDRLQIAAETDNSAFTVACVRAGMGLGVTAGQAQGALHRDLVTRSLSGTLGQAHIIFMWKKGRQPTQAVRALMNLIQESCQGASP
jgi:DNA-binding transcriptional LysR family regulator